MKKNRKRRLDLAESTLHRCWLNAWFRWIREDSGIDVDKDKN